MNSTTLTPKLWEEIRTLSLGDTTGYIENPGLLLQPEGKIASIRTDPGSYNLEVLKAVLLLHRYSLLHSPRDIVQGTRLILNSVSLSDEPGYAYFFFLFASHSWDLFEWTTQIQYVDSAVALLEHLRGLRVLVLGNNVNAMISLLFACACMQCYLQEGEEQARESALKASTDARQNFAEVKWMSSPRTRTLIVIADVVRHRYEIFGPQEEFDADPLDVARSILDMIPVVGDGQFQFNAPVVLVMALVLQLSKEADCTIWRCNLRALHYLASMAFSANRLTSSENPSSKETLKDISNALDRSTFSSSHRALCLIFTADNIDSEDPGPEMEANVNRVQVDDWTREWELARQYLRQQLQVLEPGTSSSAQVQLKEFQIFSVVGKADHRLSRAQVRFRAVEPDEAHICIFKLNVVPAGPQEEEPGPLTHAEFSRRFRALAQGLSQEELDFLIQYPDEIGNFFTTSKVLRGLEEPLVKWKGSPAVMAYILYLRRGQNNFKKAGHNLYSVTLDKEPGHSPFFYQLAADLRGSETDNAAVSLSGMLMKEFLRVQELGTPLHFLGMVELASTLTLEFLHRKGRLVSFAVALELFREAVTARFSAPWPFVAKKTVIFGRILGNRYRYFVESQEDLEKTTDILDILWDVIPLGQPFRASVLELIVISALLYLSPSLNTNTWFKALKHLTLAVELHIHGSLEEGIGLDNEDTADIAEILLSGGLDPAGYYSLTSQAMCLVHNADMIRAIAYDACSRPGFFGLSVSLYKRSLGLQPERDEAYEQESYAVSSAWASEKARLTHAILALGRGDPSDLTSEKSSETMAIFDYRAVYTTSSHDSQSCLLHYYPTWVSYPPNQRSEIDAASVAGSIPMSSEIGVPPWPDDFMSLPEYTPAASVSDRRILPSTIIPGFEKVIEDEGHEIFKMPLELRTIRAFMRSIDSEVRDLERTTSYISESVIRWSTQPVYWNPKDVQLGNRMARLKSESPYFARLAQLQALLGRGPERCLELVESSRTHFWNRLLRLQTSFEGLPEDLASRLQATAHELDKCRSQSVASASKEEIKRQWELEIIFGSLLSQARKVPEFENLLMPKSHEVLMQASSGGPVIVLLGNDSTYAALIVRSSGVDSVFLPSLTDQAIDKFIVGLNRASKDARSIVAEEQIRNSGLDDERYLGPKKLPMMTSYEVYLDGLWKFIVKPVFELLGLLANSKPIQERPRLWWCPTGRFTFLPIHAAGNNFGKDNMESVSKYVVSSYTPTLSALINAREKTKKSPKHFLSDLSTLVLAQPKTLGHASLPMTLKEIEILEKFIPSDLLLRVGKGALEQANTNRKVDEAMKYLEDASILHLACHGHQDRANPLNSGFELSDGRLSLSKLISCRNPNAFLAFLSACESAANDVDVPDESLNLAAAMIFAGFRSVIGTMWTMNDNDGPQVAQAIYGELFKHTNRVLDPNVVPFALDAAVRKLQEDGVHPSRWATYVHVGM